MLSCIRPPHHLHFRRFFCKSSISAPDMERYREAFARRMSMAGIRPHHRIALGVSGGADSMALCVLTSWWKSKSWIGSDESSGFIDGLLGIVVDHKLRQESSEEAYWVCDRVSKMGIRCKVVPCDWADGKPKQGHLEEAARDMRYQIFQEVCIHHQIEILLVAHHADDQAELFILRLSRNSGVLGLAGMAFVSQLFPVQLEGCDLGNHGVLLVRPMLEFFKEDMYNICQGGNQEWVEDPSNQSTLFARNRIRLSLRNSSFIFRSELQALVAACRLTRSFVENVCYMMMEKSLTIMDHGYAIIDLKKLNPSIVEDLCLSRFLAFVLQFVSQRHRPIRGGALQLLLDYIRNFPCKTAITAAGCYLCAAPGSKGTKVLVCASLDSPEASRTAISTTCCHERHHPSSPTDINDIIMNVKLSKDDSTIPKNVPFLYIKSPMDILEEAKKLRIIGDSTDKSIILLQMVENKHFNTKAEVKDDHDPRNKTKPTSISGIPLHSGQICHFMSRFVVLWKFCGKLAKDGFFPEYADSKWESKEENQQFVCQSCIVAQETIASIRSMVDADWLYLANLTKSQIQGEFQKQPTSSGGNMPCSDMKGVCSDYRNLSAQRALSMLKSIPLCARRALPVLVGSQGLLLSVPLKLSTSQGYRLEEALVHTSEVESSNIEVQLLTLHSYIVSLRAGGCVSKGRLISCTTGSSDLPEMEQFMSFALGVVSAMIASRMQLSLSV